MANVKSYNLMNATDALFRIGRLPDGHGKAYLLDRLMRYFAAEPAAVSVNVPVIYNNGVRGEAEITRTGELIAR